MSLAPASVAPPPPRVEENRQPADADEQPAAPAPVVAQGAAAASLPLSVLVLCCALLVNFVCFLQTPASVPAAPSGGALVLPSTSAQPASCIKVQIDQIAPLELALV